MTEHEVAAREFVALMIEPHQISMKFKPGLPVYPGTVVASGAMTFEVTAVDEQSGIATAVKR